ncbi:MAG: SMP-30/gluconolactonase/LRE family protein [Acidimicrobiia bacterium]|nr:SMP-30/gluconolactonase/LRE family protein [Acidimicrobiia bacterium]
MKTRYTLACCVALGGIAAAQQPRAFPQPTPEKQVTVSAIAGVIAAGAQWTLVWQGADNADGLVGTSDGGILFAQEQPSTVGRLDANDRFSIAERNTRGTGALGIDHRGRLIGAERTCSDPGGKPDECKEDANLTALSPTRQVIASRFGGKPFWRMGEVQLDSRGGAYFSDENGTYFVNPSGTVSLVADKSVRTNGMMLSRDEKTLYLTNGRTIVAFDVQADGTTGNQRDFAALKGGNGDGMCIDGEGRLYVSAGDAGFEVFSAQGAHLGVIPLPRSASSCAFSGPDKKVLYGKGGGMNGPDGRNFTTPPGVRNNAKAIYKIDTIAQGYLGRAK